MNIRFERGDLGLLRDIVALRILSAGVQHRARIVVSRRLLIVWTKPAGSSK